LGIMRAHTHAAKQSETPARVRVLTQKIHIYIYTVGYDVVTCPKSTDIRAR